MKSVDVKCFFSCSFNDLDVDINNFFKSICLGLDIKPSNVSSASSQLPLDKAKSLIEESEGLIAICVKREELKDGTFNMPQAVNDEIAFAYGREIPILAFIEKSVNKGGFKEKFRTYHEFDRNKLNEHAEVEKIVRAIHEFKVGVLDDDHVPQMHDPSDSYAENLTHLIELKKTPDDFVWEYITTKKIVYKRKSSTSFPVSVFSTSTVNVPEDAKDVEWEFENLGASRSLKLVPTIDECSPVCVEVRLKPEPAAEKGDEVSYRTLSKSRYLIPLWEDEAGDDKKIYLEKGEFKVFDGLLFIHRTKSAGIEFRLAREYGLELDKVVPFVASYTSGIDFEVPAELERMEISKDDFGGALTIRMKIQSALPGHIYGIAWNPLTRPEREGRAGAIDPKIRDM